MTDIRTVLIQWSDTSDPYEVDVVVEDGTKVLDHNYDFDERIFFYFDNEAEFQAAKTGYQPGIDFKIIEETDSWSLRPLEETGE